MKKLHMFFHINLENNSAGGILNFLRGLILELDKKIDITYYTMRYPEFGDERYSINQVVLKHMNKNPNEKGLIAHNLVYLLCLSKYLLLHRFGHEDILFFNRIDNVLPAVFFQRKPRKILIIHGSSQFVKNEFEQSSLKRHFNKISEKLAFKFFDDIILVSQDGPGYYAELYPKYKDKIKFIPTYVDQRLFQKKSVVDVEEDNQLSYIYFGRFVKQKGCEYFREYFEMLNRKGVNYQATMIGEGELAYLFEDLDNVNVVGTVTQEKLLDYLNQKVILLMFSRWEGMPLTLLEALSTGTPAITSDAGEMKFIMCNGQNGYHFADIPSNYENILRMSKKINRDYWGYSERSVLSVKEYSIENVTHKYFDLLLKEKPYER